MLFRSCHHGSHGYGSLRYKTRGFSRAASSGPPGVANNKHMVQGREIVLVGLLVSGRGVNFSEIDDESGERRPFSTLKC